MSLVYLYFLFFFFFSSRRRHTRWPRDWSSDVCSSDLRAAKTPAGSNHQGDLAREAGGCFRSHRTGNRRDPGSQRPQRSEERRVGKGVDLGGGRINKKKKRREQLLERNKE